MRLPDMKMEMAIVAPAAGTVREIRVSAGETIEAEGVRRSLSEQGQRR